MRITFTAFDALVDISTLVDSPYQTNKHSSEQIEQLALMMREHGVSSPISVVRGTNRICFGHGRRDAAKLNGWKTYPVIYQQFASESEEIVKVTSDNGIALQAELDFSRINELNLDLGPDFNTELWGVRDFSVEPLDKIEKEKSEKLIQCPKCLHEFSQKKAELINV